MRARKVRPGHRIAQMLLPGEYVEIKEIYNQMMQDPSLVTAAKKVTAYIGDIVKYDHGETHFLRNGRTPIAVRLTNHTEFDEHGQTIFINTETGAVLEGDAFVKAQAEWRKSQKKLPEPDFEYDENGELATAPSSVFPTPVGDVQLFLPRNPPPVTETPPAAEPEVNLPAAAASNSNGNGKRKRSESAAFTKKSPEAA